MLCRSGVRGYSDMVHPLFYNSGKRIHLASAVAQDNVRNHPRWQTILQTGSTYEDSRHPQ